MLVPHNSQDCEAGAKRVICAHGDEDAIERQAKPVCAEKTVVCVHTKTILLPPIHTSNVGVSPAQIFYAFADTCCCGRVGLYGAQCRIRLLM